MRRSLSATTARCSRRSSRAPATRSRSSPTGALLSRASWRAGAPRSSTSSSRHAARHLGLRAGAPPAPRRAASARRSIVDHRAARLGLPHRRALGAGVDYYLRKPVNAVELLHRGAHPPRSPPARRGAERANTSWRASRASCAPRRRAWCSRPRWRRWASWWPAWRTRSTRRWPPWSPTTTSSCAASRLRDALEGPASRRRRSRAISAAVEDLSKVTRQACARITDIVRTLRTFARLDEADVKAVDLHEGLESTLVLIAHLHQGRHRRRRRLRRAAARRVPPQPDQPGVHEPDA